MTSLKSISLSTPLFSLPFSRPPHSPYSLILSLPVGASRVLYPWAVLYHVPVCPGVADSRPQHPPPLLQHMEVTIEAGPVYVVFLSFVRYHEFSVVPRR